MKNTKENRNKIIGALVIIQHLEMEGNDKVLTKHLNGIKLPRDIEPCFVEKFDIETKLPREISLDAVKNGSYQVRIGDLLIPLNETTADSFAELHEGYWHSYYSPLKEYSAVVKGKRYYYNLYIVKSYLQKELRYLMNDLQNELNYHKRMVEYYINELSVIPNSLY